MKRSFLTLTFLVVGLVSFAQKKSPIDGNWLLVESNGQKLNHERPQFKTFNQGYYCVIVTKKEDGSFQSAWAGPFKLEGNKYMETYQYGSNPKWFDWKDEQEWALKGDTLIMKGHTKAIDPTGKEHPGTIWSQFSQKWVRAK